MVGRNFGPTRHLFTVWSGPRNLSHFKSSCICERGSAAASRKWVAFKHWPGAAALCCVNDIEPTTVAAKKGASAWVTRKT